MPGLADLLASRREDILQRFERAVRQWLPTAGLSRSAILDSLPELFDEIQRALRAKGGQQHEPSAPCHEESTAGEHGAQRLSLGYDMAQLIREYALLRTSLFELLRETGVVLDLEEQQALHHCIDLAMGDSAFAHKRLRDEEHLQVEQEREALLAREQAARTEAEQRRALLRTLIDQSGDAIIMADAQGVLRLFNPEAERLHGFPLREVPTSQWVETYGLSAEDGRPLRLEEVPLYRALQGEAVQDERIWIRRPDGSRRLIAVSARPLRLPEGAPGGAVLIARDVTARQALEREREEALALLDMLLATAPVGMAFLDRELRYVRINHALAAINGVPVEQTLGRTVREVVPQLAPRTEALYRRVLETEEPVLNAEVTGTTPGTRGDIGHWLVSYYPVKDREGRTFMMGAVVVDITERKRHEEHLRQTADFRERFLGIVSHDLRNPLGTISLSANHLLRREALPERATRAVQRIANNAEQMARMIGDLLDLTRGRLGGGIPITPAPTDLDLIGRRVLGEMEAAHPTRELRLEAEGDLRGEWDADRLAQLLGNLLKNALDYSPESTPVTLSLRDEDGQVRIDVRNVGEPIPAELLPILFEPFRQGARQTRSGLGLGLYIVQQIASAHGGTVEARSTREDGTRLTVRLPRVPPPRA